MKKLIKISAVILFISIAAGCQKTEIQPALNDSADLPYLKLDPADFIVADHFVEGVTNPYFPLNVGDTLFYETTVEEDGALVTEESYSAVTDDVKIIVGISCTVVHDVVFQDGELSEDTFDWYAQDKYGNVWYLGEDTKSYNDDGTFTTEGSWEHGVDGATGGLFMLADPASHIGHIYQQENLEGEAEDYGKVVSVGETVTIDFGTFTDCVKTAETSPLEPDIHSYKYYAPGIGEVYAYSATGEVETQELTGISF